MKISFYTNKGAVREHNEDALMIADCIIGNDMTMPGEITADNKNVIAVFDGMGGYFGGRLASSLACRIMLDEKESIPAGKTKAEECLKGIFSKIVVRFTEQAEANNNYAKMGATCAGVVTGERKAVAWNCGDCRVYQYRNGFLDCITRDHSVVQALYESGEISMDEMRTHPNKNKVTSSLQPGETFSIYAKEIKTDEETVLFICSDGVWEALPTEEIENILASDNAAQNLAKALLDSNCTDNVSFAVVSDIL